MKTPGKNTYKKNRSPEQRAVLELAMEFLRHSPCRSPKRQKDFQRIICEKVPAFRGKTVSNLQHYLKIANVFLNAEKFLNSEDLDRLLDSGLQLDGCVASIGCINPTHEAFRHMTQLCADNITLKKDDFTELILQEVANIEKTSPEAIIRNKKGSWHNWLRDNIAVPWLLDQGGCTLVAKEVYFDEKSWSLDAVGWRPDGSLVGIEVKVDTSDYSQARKKKKFEVQPQYFNRYYILTDSEEVCALWEKACSRKHALAGRSSLYYNGKTVIPGPDRGQLEIAPSKRNMVLRSMRTKLLQDLSTVALDETLTTPSKLTEKILASLGQNSSPTPKPPRK